MTRIMDSMGDGSTVADWEHGIMARTTAAQITEWGTPPDPKPTGWDAIKLELGKRPGEWANVGEYSTASARKIAADRVPATDGYESRIVASETTSGRANLWVRFVGGDGAVEVRDAPAKPAKSA